AWRQLATNQQKVCHSLATSGEYWRPRRHSSPGDNHERRLATSRSSPGDSTQSMVLCGGLSPNPPKNSFKHVINS
ncbi:hypothetical protein A2U01_0063668, partial [Trifolium medium]|nr:hypothetical protein [Trifolium medium]